MKPILSLAMAIVLSSSLCAADEHKEKMKVKVKDAAGDTIEHKSSAKSQSDGDYKEKSRTKVNGDTVDKRRVEHEGDGDHKEKVEIKGENGKYKSKTKIDK